MRTSVLIVTKNRAEALVLCVRSIVQSKSVPDEVIIVDGSNDKNITIQVSGLFKKIRCVYRHNPGIGLPQARNAAVKIAQGKIVVFVDDDCHLLPKTLTDLDDSIKKHGVSGVIGRIVNGNSYNIFSCVQQSYYDIWTEQIKKDYFIPGLDIAAFERKTLLRFPFRENFPNGIDEDVELGVRFRSHGIALHFDRAICVHHFGRQSLFSLMKRNFLTGFANEYIKMHYGIDTRSTARRMSTMEKIAIAGQNSNKLQHLQRVIFWVVFWIYPVFSGLGRLIFYIRKNV